MSSDCIPVLELSRPWMDVSRLGFEGVTRLFDIPKDEPHTLLVCQYSDCSFDVSYFARKAPPATIEVSFSQEQYLSGTTDRLGVTVSPKNRTGHGETTIALYPNRLHVHDLNVHQEVRRSGLGRILLDISLGLAKLTNKALFSMKVKNDGVESFLLNYGFTQEQVDTKQCGHYHHESVVIGAATEDELGLPNIRTLGDTCDPMEILIPIGDKRKETPIHDRLSGVPIQNIDVPSHRIYALRSRMSNEGSE